jgi:hypothetical protein
MAQDSLTLESAREVYGATQQDSEGRYYSKQLGQAPKYGYHTHMGGLYVCFTCGHLCECGEE